MAFFASRFLFVHRAVRRAVRRASRVFNMAFHIMAMVIILQLASTAGTGSACGQQAPNVGPRKIATHLRGFGVPFKINAEDSSYIEVQLFVTKDLGKTWQFHSRQSTDSEEFPFEADEDGEYWFALKTLDKDRKLVPEGQIQAELKIVVDTVKPKLTFNTDSDSAGRVVCSWDARDQNLDVDNCRILYRDHRALPEASDGEWKQVPITMNFIRSPGVFRDQIAWWPESSGQSLDVRMEVADSAGNKVVEDRVVSVQVAAWRNKSSSTAYVGNMQRPAQALANTNNPLQSSPPVRPPSVAPQHVSAGSKMVCEGGVCRLVPQNQHYKPSRFVKNQTGLAHIGSPPEWGAPPPPIEDNDPANRMKGVRGPMSTVSTSVTSTPTHSASLTPKPGAPAPVSPAAVSSAAVAKSEPASKPPVSIPWESETENPIGFIQNSVSSSTLDRISRIQTNQQAPPNFKKLPGGTFVSESTASINNSHMPMAQLTLGTAQWPGRAGESRTANARMDPQFHGNGRTGQVPPLDPQRMKVHSVGFGATERTPKAPMLFGPELDEIQFVRVGQFDLDYGIEAIDPSGVDKVVLWMTRDGGQNWESRSTDPDGTSPFPVEVESVGTYGFRIVVHSRDGLTGLAPKRGEAADVYVNFDNLAPRAKITSVPYGRGNEAGRLVINWEVDDSHLAVGPITLSSSPHVSGPWTVIEKGLLNTGRYVWKVGAHVPEKVFLRLEALDRAGNVGVFQLSQTIDISGLVPRGRIRAVRPVSN